jgi:hypothetical protein
MCKGDQSRDPNLMVHFIGFPGTTKIPNFDENIGATSVKLSPEELKEVAAAVPEHEIAGGRYAEDLVKQTWKYVTTPPLSSYVAPK